MDSFQFQDMIKSDQRIHLGYPRLVGTPLGCGRSMARPIRLDPERSANLCWEKDRSRAAWSWIQNATTNLPTLTALTDIKQKRGLQLFSRQNPYCQKRHQCCPSWGNRSAQTWLCRPFQAHVSWSQSKTFQPRDRWPLPSHPLQKLMQENFPKWFVCAHAPKFPSGVLAYSMKLSKLGKVPDLSKTKTMRMYTHFFALKASHGRSKGHGRLGTIFDTTWKQAWDGNCFMKLSSKNVLA